MAMRTAHLVALVVGVLMIGLALFLVVRQVLPQGPVTSSRWLDLAFAAFFLVRGGMNVRGALRARDTDVTR